MKRILLFILALAVTLGFTNTNTLGQGTVQPPAETKKQNALSDEEIKDWHWWDCTLPGGNFCTALGKISNVSIHEYIVKSPTQQAGAVPTPVRVTEVNVDTDGSVVARFYFIESVTDASGLNVTKTALERSNQVADELANRTGTEKVWAKVQKDYPLSTHAHTVEYRLDSKENLQRLYGSVKRAWTTGKGARFTIVNQ